MKELNDDRSDASFSFSFYIPNNNILAVCIRLRAYEADAKSGVYPCKEGLPRTTENTLHAQAG